MAAAEGRHVALNDMNNNNNKQYDGSRPPPTKRPATGSLSVVFIMALIIAGAIIASGGSIPVDPNGPGGPPTIEPYYNSANYPAQHIISQSGQQSTTKNNLQLRTFGVNNCGQNAAILFVIDTSGSMSFAGKMNNTKKALHYFINNIGGKEVVGIDTFSANVKTAIVMDYFNNNKNAVSQVIDGLTPGGWTVTRDAMQQAYGQLKQAITYDDFPGYAYNLILMTDGVPESPDSMNDCEVTVPDPNLANGIRCFARKQDPRIPVNIPDEIKNLGVNIYTINVYSPSYPSDKLLFPYLDKLLKNISSSPISTHYFISTNASNLSDILHNINNNICYGNFNGFVKPTP